MVLQGTVLNWKQTRQEAMWILKLHSSLQWWVKITTYNIRTKALFWHRTGLSGSFCSALYLKGFHSLHILLKLILNPSK